MKKLFADHHREKGREWKRAQLGHTSEAPMKTNAAATINKGWAPMKVSPSFVANEQTSLVYLPSMGGMSKKEDSIANGLDGGNITLVIAYLSAQVDIKRELEHEGNC